MTSSPKHESQLLIDFYRLSFARSLYGNVSETTLEKYRRSINRFEESLGRATQLSDLTPATYFAFKDWLTDRLSVSSAKTMLMHHATLWRYAHANADAAQCPFGAPLQSMVEKIGGAL
jgi:site-specific recombinase XerD